MDAARLIAEVRRALAAAGDPERARGQQAYMKSVMPHYGVTMPIVRGIARAIHFDATNADAWRADLLALYGGAKKREERYVALLLAARSKPLFDGSSLPMVEEMVVTGAWWDLVDLIATSLLASMLVHDEKKVRAAMLRWAKSDDIWKRRASILCQIPRRAETDTALLEACIEPSLGRKEFWLRKAIGWALRQYARTDPKWVSAYVERHRDRLAPLSVREATKHLSVASATSSPARGARRRKT